MRFPGKSPDSIQVPVGISWCSFVWRYSRSDPGGREVPQVPVCAMGSSSGQGTARGTQVRWAEVEGEAPGVPRGAEVQTQMCSAGSASPQAVRGALNCEHTTGGFQPNLTENEILPFQPALALGGPCAARQDRMEG